jgi:hypothetical protein
MAQATTSQRWDRLEGMVAFNGSFLGLSVGAKRFTDAKRSLKDKCQGHLPAVPILCHSPRTLDQQGNQAERQDHTD